MIYAKFAQLINNGNKYQKKMYYGNNYIYKIGKVMIKKKLFRKNKSSSNNFIKNNK